MHFFAQLPVKAVPTPVDLGFFQPPNYSAPIPAHTSFLGKNLFFSTSSWYCEETLEMITLSVVLSGVTMVLMKKDLIHPKFWNGVFHHFKKKIQAFATLHEARCGDSAAPNLACISVRYF